MSGQAMVNGGEEAVDDTLHSSGDGRDDSGPGGLEALLLVFGPEIPREARFDIPAKSLRQGAGLQVSEY